MSRKIFRSNLFICLVVVLCSLTCILGSLYNYYGEISIAQLKDQLQIAATATELQGLEFLEKTESSRYRLTWIDPKGQVLYDSKTSAEVLGSHLVREEIHEALRTGSGSSVHYSDTQTEQTIYEAMCLSDGSVLRISVHRDSALGLLIDLIPAIAMVLLLTTALSLLLSRSMTKRIVDPINCIDPENPLEVATDPEITPLLQRLHQQNQQISKQLQELKDRAEEFRMISEGMQEGLVLLDAQGLIRSINPAAERIFCTEHPCKGGRLADLDASGEMERSLQEALEQGHSTIRQHGQGRSYRFDLSRISADGAVLGAVLLAIDITENVNAQKTRREFSANVSHELKSPLQTIMGSAELLETGMVRPEDQGRFYSHIRKESRRLLDLIQDIIRLSQLDEGAKLSGEEVDLYRLCSQAHADLQGKAAENNICFNFQGEQCSIYGIRRLLEELVYNLCDNAIKYNVQDGQVDLSLRYAEGRIELEVSDSGIGIPPEHQERIFERFYRVDKSHSKQSGGTGLGLSIVKHSAAYFKADISLQSQEGKGTTITIVFPY